MCPSIAPRWHFNRGEHYSALESRGRELIDFFRGLAPKVAAQRAYGSPLVFLPAFAAGEQLLASYFRAPRVGLCIVDRDLCFLAVNTTLAELNGRSPEEHIGRSVREVIGELADVIEPQIKRVVATGEPVLYFEITSAMPTRTESGFWINHLIPINDANGTVTQVGGIVVEYTEQEKLAQSLRSVSQSLQNEKKRLQVLADVHRALSEQLDVPQAFPRISASLRRLLLHEYAALAVRDEKSGRLARLAMDFPLRKGPVTVDSEIDADNDPRGTVVRDRTPLIFGKEEIQQFPTPTSDYLLAEGLRSLCCAPLLRPKSNLGMLTLGSTRADAFQTDDLMLVSQVASLLAIAVENARISREVAQLRNRAEQEKRYLEGEVRSQSRFEGIIGESQALADVIRQVEVVAPSDATAMIQGETGTGKGLIARAIHNLSRRSERAFITLNCAAIPTGLLESELFGHEKGAFTGAISRKIGRLEAADHGTIFLDEIGEIPSEVQPKLLRVLQDQEFERLGSTKTIKVDLRLIAATNRDLARSVAEKQFRSDLFYRLNVFPIHIPSLRERREDIPLLVRYFVQKFSRQMDRRIDTISHETMRALGNCDWPGNIRELENFIERSVILTSGAVLQVPLAQLKTETSFHAEPSLQDTERQHIIRVLRETKGVISGARGAARRLGLKRSTLQSRMQRLGIRREDYLGQGHE